MGEKKRDYWRSTREKFARCFERYIQRKLEKADRKNTYLTGLSSGGEGPNGLWPTNEEVDAMTSAFDAIFSELRDGLKKGRYSLRQQGGRMTLVSTTPLAEAFRVASSALRRRHAPRSSTPNSTLPA